MNWLYGKFTKPEKLCIEEELTRESAKTLYGYVEKQLWRQLANDLAIEKLGVDELPHDVPFEESIKGVIIPETTFVFGHTHKPFSKYTTFTGYPGWVDVYNTGGWVVESVKPAPNSRWGHGSG